MFSPAHFIERLFDNKFGTYRQAFTNDALDDQNISQYIAASESFRNNILDMLSEFAADPAIDPTGRKQQIVSKFYIKLVSINPEVIIEAREAGHITELAEVKKLNPDAIEKAFSIELALEPSCCSRYDRISSWRTRNHEELGYSKLTLRCCFGYTRCN